MTSTDKSNDAAKAIQMVEEARQMPTTVKNASTPLLDVKVDPNKQLQSDATTTTTTRPQDRNYLTYEQFSLQLARKYTIPILLVSATATAATYFAGLYASMVVHFVIGVFGFETFLFSLAIHISMLSGKRIDMARSRMLMLTASKFAIYVHYLKKPNIILSDTCTRTLTGVGIGSFFGMLSYATSRSLRELTENDDLLGKMSTFVL